MIGWSANIGGKFGRLTVIDVIQKYNRNYFLCTCECGNRKEVKCSHLRSGKIKSCGCYNKEVSRLRSIGRVSASLKPDNYSAKYRVFQSYKKHAEDRRLSFNLSFDDFVAISSQSCHYCGAPPTNSMNARQSRSKYIYNGIDRVNNSLGYESHNCVPCCKMCNVAKSTLSYDEFLEWAGRVSTHCKVLNSNNLAIFDVDDTLIKWSPTEEELKDKGIEFEFMDSSGNSRITLLVPHLVHIEQLKKHKIRQHTVGVWSAGGSKWAAAVVRALNLEPYVDICLQKPSWAYDDKKPEEYMPPSQWKEDK